ncbi:MAG: GAF domain-containing protein [Bacteroidales bacterium]|nr:GAF domain-containing protein [Bacteroidales bacterium]
MKKLSIQSTLLISFCLISLIVFISGIRELLVLNSLKEQKSTLKVLSETDALLKENTIVLKSDISALQRIVSTKSETELQSLLFEHKENKLTEKDNFKNILRNLKNNIKKENAEALILTDKYVNNADYLFNGSYLTNYKKISKKKENLINIDSYFIETINSNSKLSKKDLIKKTETEKTDLYKQLQKTYNIILTKLEEAQKTNGNYYSEYNKKVDERYNKAQNTAFTFFILVILVLILTLVFLLKKIPDPIKKIQGHLDVLTEGELPENIELNAGTDINRIGKTINKLVEGLRRIVDFSSEIGRANFDTKFDLLGNNDVLGTSLLTLRENLQTAQEEDEKRKKEDAQRNRTNEGLTKFNEIMRQQSGSIKELADVIISALVKFLNANQGGLFFLNEEDKENVHYELLGAYAYNRKKFLSKEIKPGEGLIGAVALEKYTVYMTEVPDEYVEIESGTGSANPRSILIVPLKIEENVLGIIELASFNEIEQYEIEMVEKVAESIASSMTNARINMQTSALLQRSKDQEKLVEEQEQEIIRYISEIKDITKQVKALERENKKLKEKTN